MKDKRELILEAARVLGCYCFCQVSIEGNQITGIPNWHVMCAPGVVRKSMMPVLWADVVTQAEAIQQWPMMMHLRKGDWACTSLNPWFDEWGTGFDNTMTQPVPDWWLLHGEDVAFPRRSLAKAASVLNFQVKRQ